MDVKDDRASRPQNADHPLSELASGMEGGKREQYCLGGKWPRGRILLEQDRSALARGVRHRKITRKGHYYHMNMISLRSERRTGAERRVTVSRSLYKRLQL